MFVSYVTTLYKLQILYRVNELPCCVKNCKGMGMGSRHLFRNITQKLVCENSRNTSDSTADARLVLEPSTP
jgi:hypothetical protein